MLNELYKINFKEIIFYNKRVIENYFRILKLYFVLLVYTLKSCCLQILKCALGICSFHIKFRQTLFILIKNSVKNTLIQLL